MKFEITMKSGRELIRDLPFDLLKILSKNVSGRWGCHGVSCYGDHCPMLEGEFSCTTGGMGIKFKDIEDIKLIDEEPKEEYPLTLDDLGAGKQYQSSSGNTVYVNDSILLYSCDGKAFPAMPRLRFKELPEIIDRTIGATKEDWEKIDKILKGEL